MISKVKRPYFQIEKDTSRVPTEYVEKQHFVETEAEELDCDQQDNQASVATPNQIKRDDLQDTQNIYSHNMFDEQLRY